MKTPRGLSVPGCVWIAPEEPAEMMEGGVNALSRNLRCNDPTCPHTLIETHGADGRYERRLSCTPWWDPPVVVDKHIPSFNGLHAAQHKQIFLCAWHGYNCFDARLVELGILNEAADRINWGFRLLTRADTDEKAVDLRDAMARCVVRHAAMPNRLWTLDQAEELMGYIDKCWMYPPMIRQAWLDVARLALVRRQGEAGFLNTTGISEGSHQKWTLIMANSQKLQLISESVVKTTGITAEGKLAVGGGFFQDAQMRWSDAEGLPEPETTDRRVRYVKACIAFLNLGAGCIYPHRLCEMSISEFQTLAAVDGEAEGNDGGDERAWRRHRRQSGGRMSSSFRPPILRAASDEELQALVAGVCAAIANSEPPTDAISAADVRQRLEPVLGGLTLRTAIVQTSIDEFHWCQRARSAECTLVPHFPPDNVRRHAEAAATRRAARGVAPQFPAELQPMLQLLKHGGELSFAKDGFLSVENVTGRCQCLDSTYLGVFSAHLSGGWHDERGKCKHDQLGHLCAEASTGPAAAAAVRVRCAAYVCNFMEERERGKPRAERCMPLYEAGKSGDVEKVLAALRIHPSIPHSGKGVPMEATGPSTEPVGSSSDEDDAGQEGCSEEAAHALGMLPCMRCTFQATELATEGFGVVFVANDEVGGGMGIVVARYGQTFSGAVGPAQHVGEQLRPRDIVLSSSHDCPDLTKLLAPDGLLSSPPGLPVTLDFVRPPATTRPTRYLGGRPAATKPKYGRNARGKKSSWASHVRDSELLGGAPSRSIQKPQHSRARDHKARDVGEPSADEQLEAVFRAAEAAGETSEAQQHEVNEIAAEVEAQLLRRRELSEQERAERDAELVDMVYSQ